MFAVSHYKADRARIGNWCLNDPECERKNHLKEKSEIEQRPQALHEASGPTVQNRMNQLTALLILTFASTSAHADVTLNEIFTVAELPAVGKLPDMYKINPYPSTPHCLYNSWIHPFTRFAIKGALWYQGESNGNEGISYFYKISALISGWRTAWGQGDFPFYFVQLAAFQSPTDVPAGGFGWALCRMAQLKSLAIWCVGRLLAR